jgi:hypothetical protein
MPPPADAAPLRGKTRGSSKKAAEEEAGEEEEEAAGQGGGMAERPSKQKKNTPPPDEQSERTVASLNGVKNIFFYLIDSAGRNSSTSAGSDRLLLGQIERLRPYVRIDEGSSPMATVQKLREYWVRVWDVSMWPLCAVGVCFSDVVCVLCRNARCFLVQSRWASRPSKAGYVSSMH